MAQIINLFTKKLSTRKAILNRGAQLRHADSKDRSFRVLQAITNDLDRLENQVLSLERAL